MWFEVKGEGLHQFNVKKKKFGPRLMRADAYAKLAYKKFSQLIKEVADEGALPYNFDEKVWLLHPDPGVHIKKNEPSPEAEEAKEQDAFVQEDGVNHNELVIVKKRVGVVDHEACLYDAGVTTVDRCVENGGPDSENLITLTLEIDEVLELV